MHVVPVYYFLSSFFVPLCIGRKACCWRGDLHQPESKDWSIFAAGWLWLDGSTGRWTGQWLPEWPHCFPL